MLPTDVQEVSLPEKWCCKLNHDKYNANYEEKDKYESGPPVESTTLRKDERFPTRSKYIEMESDQRRSNYREKYDHREKYDDRNERRDRYEDRNEDRNERRRDRYDL